MALSNVQKLLIENTGPILFRLVWWNYLAPSKRGNFAEELFDAIVVGIIRSAEIDLKKTMPHGAKGLFSRVVRSLVEADIGDFASLIPAFGDDTYENLVCKIIRRRDE